MAQFFTAHQVDQRISRAQQGLTTEANGDQVRDLAVREARHLLRLGDNRGEIFAFQMIDAWPADDAAGPDTVVIGADGWVDDAVRGHHNRAREAGKLDLLVLPAAAVVTNQMLEFTQFRVTVRWQHFTVGVDVNPGTFCLLQQVVQIFQVMAGNQNAFAFGRFDVDLSRGGVTIFSGLASVRMLITLKFIWPISIEHSSSAFISAGQVPSHAMILWYWA